MPKTKNNKNIKDNISFSELEKIIGYTFKNSHWLERALTHSSTNDGYNYQRLEFLGDRVLGLVMAGELFMLYRDDKEGDLAKRHTALVQGSTCTMIGKSHGLCDHIILSDSESAAGGHSNENIIGDVVEAILGAVYIDGGYEPAKTVVLKLWGDNVHSLDKIPLDPKTELQEWVQARSLDLPTYEIVDRSGPDHAPVFVLRVSVDGYGYVDAEGASRRQAEKIAARNMLKKIKK
jgi:ribonuclease-3